MKNTPRRIWWHCTDETQKHSLIDKLCDKGHASHQAVAALTATGQLISNLTIRENIELLCAWECREKLLAPIVLECLQRGFSDATDINTVLSQQGARLTSGERRWVALARALHTEATWLVVEDDESGAWPFHEERLLTILRYFPTATLHWVSLGKPDKLPDDWSRGDQGEWL